MNDHEEEADPPALEECDGCGTEFDPDDGTDCDCRECYSCHDIVPDDRQEWSQRAQEVYCVECFNDTFTYCNDCGEEDFQDDTYYSERREVTLCDSCYADEFDGQPCEEMRRASCCDTYNVYLNPLTERFECECKASARKRDPLSILARFPLDITTPERVLEVAA